jgi:predicted TIM-barrel fold metal-dependent hydrolase
VTDQALIDADVHPDVASIEVLAPYLDEHWQEVTRTSQFRGPTDTAYPPNAATSRRPDAGAVTPDSVGELLAELDVEVAVLNCLYAVESVHNPDAASALARAANDWLVEEWLSRDPRLRASVVVPSSLPALAAEEIDRVGSHPGFVGVLLPVRSLMPYGNRNHLPTLEAAARNGLAVWLHFGGASGHPPTAVGWPTSYVEEYVDMASAFQTQLMSLITEGVFEHLPGLRVVCAESGFAWVPAFMWRFDRLWRGLRREIPWAARPPSDTIRAHVRFTTQPMDVPAEDGQLARLVEMLGSDELLLFASDHPHRHTDDPRTALGRFPPALRPAIARENARSFLRLAEASRA